MKLKSHEAKKLRGFRGAWRSRTALSGFADQYLTVRTTHHVLICECKGRHIFPNCQTFGLLFFLFGDYWDVSCCFYLKSITSAWGKSLGLKVKLLLGWFTARKLLMFMLVHVLPCFIFTCDGMLVFLLIVMYTS